MTETAVPIFAEPADDLARMYIDQRDAVIRFVLRLSFNGFGYSISRQDAEDIASDCFLEVIEKGQRVALQILARDAYADFCRRRDAAARATEAAGDQRFDHDHDPSLSAVIAESAASVSLAARDDIDRQIISGLGRGLTERQIVAELAAAGTRISQQAIHKRKRRLSRKCGPR